MKLEKIALSLFFLCGFLYADDARITTKSFDNYQKPISSPSWRYPVEIEPTTPPTSPSPSSPSFPTGPPISPCSSSASCAPGVGLESGVLIRLHEQNKKNDRSVQP